MEMSPTILLGVGKNVVCLRYFSFGLDGRKFFGIPWGIL